MDGTVRKCEPSQHRAGNVNECSFFSFFFFYAPSHKLEIVGIGSRIDPRRVAVARRDSDNGTWTCNTMW